DRYFGKRWIARLSANFIAHLFACNKFSSRSRHPDTYLPVYIAFAIHHTNTGEEAVYAALVLLQRLKGRYPKDTRSSGHKLFIAAFMVASKFLYDESYKNSTWRKIAQKLYSLPEINQMERELCFHLEWDIALDTPTISNFRALVSRDFHPGASRPYPTYPTETAYKRRRPNRRENIQLTSHRRAQCSSRVEFSSHTDSACRKLVPITQT
ncbi:hypothetical protein C8F04DRAFT_975535, partial [Mycena alexandri]